MLFLWFLFLVHCFLLIIIIIMTPTSTITHNGGDVCCGGKNMFFKLPKKRGIPAKKATSIPPPKLNVLGVIFNILSNSPIFSLPFFVVYHFFSLDNAKASIIIKTSQIIDLLFIIVKSDGKRNNASKMTAMIPTSVENKLNFAIKIPFQTVLK